MNPARIVVISGLPCSGKTKLASALRTRFSWPLLCKDEIKESLFDTVGTGDREWSRRLSGAAYEIMFAHALELARCGSVFAMEGNFREKEHRERFTRLGALGVFVQIHCRAEAQVLIDRFRARTSSGQRHVGHVDAASLQEMEGELRSSRQRALELPGATIECDTTHHWEMAIERAVNEVAQAILGSPGRGHST